MPRDYKVYLEDILERWPGIPMTPAADHGNCLRQRNFCSRMPEYFREPFVRFFSRVLT